MTTRLDQTIQDLVRAQSAASRDPRYPTSCEVLQAATHHLKNYQRLVEAEVKASRALNEAISGAGVYAP